MSQTGAVRAKATVLLADNDADWLKLQKDEFVKAGYDVLTADSPAEANQVLRDEHVDTVVWDIRLENDNDDKDVSGLEASHKTPPGVGKVITTNFAVDMATGREFRDMIPTHSPFVSYVDKHAGIPAILAAAKEVTAFSLISRNGAALWDLVSAGQSASSRQTQTWLVVVLLLALGFGVTAALTGYVGWLFLTVALAIFAVVLIGKIN